MVEVKRQQGFVRPHDDDEEEDENTVREWEDGLPSLADLISLSQCLISPQLASAFSISSPSAAPARSSADVALASHAAFSSLCGATSSSVPDPSPTSPPDSKSNLQRCLSAGDGHGVLNNSVRSEGLKRCEEGLPRSRCADSASPVDPLLERNTDDSVRPDDDDSLVVRQNHQEDADNAEVDHHVPAHALEYQDRLQSSGEQGDGRAHISESNVEHEGEGCEEPNMWRPCSFEGSGIARHVSDVDVEADEAEFTPSAAENPAGEPAARTLKRPRLVWTPELHRRFVDAVTHLGLRTAVPKTIMQLMNVEGLTRENVASHLQKYRLSLKRMQQGISGEGSAASDHIFASIPLPSNLAASGRFPPGVTAHLQDVSQVPFLLSTGSPVSIHRPGILPCPLSPMDPYSYSAAYARPAHRITQQCEVPGAQSWRQHQSDPSQPVLKK